MFLWWGPDLIQFYNDAYRPSLGSTGKHPNALGQKGEDCWPEIWDIIYPLIHHLRQFAGSVHTRRYRPKLSAEDHYGRGQNESTHPRHPSLIRDLLVYSQVSNQTILFEPVNLQQVVQDLQNEFDLSDLPTSAS
jgi:hypothetical protein